MGDLAVRSIGGHSAGGGASASVGGGGDDGMWQQTVETRLSELRGDIQGLRTEVAGEFRAVRDRQERDFRLLFGVVVTVALGLAGLLAHGFKWI